jgi:hypothetical protein
MSFEDIVVSARMRTRVGHTESIQLVPYPVSGRLKEYMKLIVYDFDPQESSRTSRRCYRCAEICNILITFRPWGWIHDQVGLVVGPKERQ